LIVHLKKRVFGGSALIALLCSGANSRNTACLYSQVDSAMHQGHERKYIEGVLFVHWPCDLWGVSRRISKCSEQALEQVHKSLLFASLAFRLQRVESKVGNLVLECECGID
jgi:hypothetical protein